MALGAIAACGTRPRATISNPAVYTAMHVEWAMEDQGLSRDKAHPWTRMDRHFLVTPGQYKNDRLRIDEALDGTQRASAFLQQVETLTKLSIVASLLKDEGSTAAGNDKADAKQGDGKTQGKKTDSDQPAPNPSADNAQADGGAGMNQNNTNQVTINSPPAGAGPTQPSGGAKPAADAMTTETTTTVTTTVDAPCCDDGAKPKRGSTGGAKNDESKPAPKKKSDKAGDAGKKGSKPPQSQSTTTTTTKSTTTSKHGKGEADQGKPKKSGDGAKGKVQLINELFNSLKTDGQIHGMDSPFDRIDRASDLFNTTAQSLFQLWTGLP